jgi:DNA-binding NtrC family response regulator
MAKILVVDDEMGIRELLSEILEDENHEVLLAPNAGVARSIYAQTQLDLILLDIWMPDADGMTLLREWVCAGTLRAPVVMMSGHASIDTALEANSLGAVGFLEKPITLHRLLSTVHKIISRSAPVVTDAESEISHTAGHEAKEGQRTSLSASGMQQHATSTLSFTNHPTESAQSNPLSPLNPQHYGSVLAHVRSNSGTDNGSVGLTKWQLVMANAQLELSLREFREVTEKIYFESLLERTNNSMTRVSEQSGLERTHLYRKLKLLNISFKRKAKHEE